MVHTLNKSIALEIHKKIFLIRETEEKIASEYSNQKMRCPVHLSIGQEPIQVDLLFQGIRARNKPIPQVSVMPANTRPAPTKAEIPNKA